MADLTALADAIIKGDRGVEKKSQQLTQELLDSGMDPKTVLNEGLVAGMNVVGEKFKANEYYVPEVLISARAMHQSMSVLKPVLAASGVEPDAKVAIGTVKGDLHDIGKNLVAMMLEGAGFAGVDLGVDVSAEKFVEAVEEGADVIAMSALLTTTMPSMKEVIDVLQEKGVRGKVKVMIGGAPVTQAYCDEITADGYAPDAASAVDTAKALLS